MATKELTGRQKAERKLAKAEAQAAPLQPAPDAVTSSAPPVALEDKPLDDSGKLDLLLEQMGILRNRVEAVEKGSTTFSPMRTVENSADILADTYKPPEELLAEARRSLTRAGQSVTGIMNSMEDPEYIKHLPPEQRPIFRSGSRVRINPAAFINGTEGYDSDDRPLTPRPWSDVLKRRRSDGRGVVLAIQYMTKTWEPKYTVHVPGVTGKDGDGFHEHELLPAA